MVDLSEEFGEGDGATVEGRSRVEEGGQLGGGVDRHAAGAGQDFLDQRTPTARKSQGITVESNLGPDGPKPKFLRNQEFSGVAGGYGTP